MPRRKIDFVAMLPGRLDLLLMATVERQAGSAAGGPRFQAADAAPTAPRLRTSYSRATRKKNGSQGLGAIGCDRVLFGSGADPCARSIKCRSGGYRRCGS